MKQRTLVQLLLPMALLIGFRWSATAQDEHKPPAPPTKEVIQEHAKKMAEKLGLTSEQTTQLVKVETDFFEKAHKLHVSMREAEKSKMEELRLAKEASMKKVLNSEQFTQYQQLAEAHRKQHPPHPHPPHPHEKQ